VDFLALLQILIISNSPIFAFCGYSVTVVFGPGDDERTYDIEASMGLRVYVLEALQMSYVWWIEAPAVHNDAIEPLAVQSLRKRAWAKGWPWVLWCFGVAAVSVDQIVTKRA